MSPYRWCAKSACARGLLDSKQHRSELVLHLVLLAACLIPVTGFAAGVAWNPGELGCAALGAILLVREIVGIHVSARRDHRARTP